MATVVLSGASAAIPALQISLDLLRHELRRRGDADVRVFDLASTPLGYCQGEFDCWVKTPGLCRAHDAEQDIVQAVHDADRHVTVDAVTFGGYSYTVKRAIDRLICLISPFFEKRMSLTHHEPRYERAASWHALGWQPAPDPSIADTWAALADANALNLLAPHVGATVLDDTSRDAWPRAIGDMLGSDAVPGGTIVDRAALREAMRAAAIGADVGNGHPPRSVALLVGSAKARGTSLSENLAAAMRERFERAGATVQTSFAVDFLRDDRARQTAQAVAAADLFVLVTPLYIDASPALPTRALTLIAEARRTHTTPARCAALINCGFPEPEHTRTALAIVRHFSTAARYTWAGGLPLGGGGAVRPDVPLDQQHGPAEHVHAALDLAVGNLMAGQSLSREAIEQMARSPMPDVLYRLAGDLGWRYQVYKNRLAQADLRARPLDYWITVTRTRHTRATSRRDDP